MMYLEIIVKAKLAGRLFSLNYRSAGGEVIAELTGRISAVYNITESNVALKTCSIPHYASTLQKNQNNISEKIWSSSISYDMQF